MKGFLKVMLLVVVAAMCLTSTLLAAADSLLAEHMGQAYGAGRQIDIAMSVKLGDGAALFVPEETFAALGKLLGDTHILAHYAKDEAGAPVMGLSIQIGDVEVVDGTALMTADGAMVTTSLLPGKTLLIPMESLTDTAVQQSLPVEIDEEAMAILTKAYETYFGVIMGWVQENPQMGGVVEGPISGTEVRSEAAQGMTLHVTAVQFKDLLVQLTQTFEQDTELQAALESYAEQSGDSDTSMADTAKALSDAAQALDPTDGALNLDAYTDAEGTLVGLDFVMEPLLVGAAETAYARYDRLDEDGRLAHDFQGRIDLEQGGQMAAIVNYVAEESHLESRSTQSMLLRGMFQPTGEEPVSHISLTDERETAREAGQEQSSDMLTLTMETLAPDGSTPEEAGTPLSVSILTNSVTSEREGNDFEAAIHLSVQAFGMEFAALSLDLTSDAYVPADISGNSVVDLATATPEAQSALMDELQAGLGQALASAIQVIPPELLAMLG